MTLLVPWVLVLVACRTAPQVQTDPRVVELIKAERYDEAGANPDLMAPAFVEALRQLNAEGTNPKQIVAVADAFFTLYPFAPRDLAIDEGVVRPVADAHYEASCRFIPEHARCLDLKSAGTMEAMKAVLWSWNEKHEDGGRCARRVLSLLDRAVARGPRWFEDLSITGEGSGRVDRELMEACRLEFADEVQLLPIAFQYERLMSFSPEARRSMNWGNHGPLTDEGRWGRYLLLRIAWLESLRYEPDFDLVAGTCVVLQSSKSETLKELGRSLEAWKRALGEFRLDAAPDLEGFRIAAEAVARCAPGTPIPDAVWYSLIAAHLRDTRFKEAEQAVRELRPRFGNEFFPSLALLIIAEYRTGERGDEWKSPDDVPRLAREALEWNPEGPTAAGAYLQLAQIAAAAAKDREVESNLKAAVVESGKPSPYEMPGGIRSEAGRLLAWHYQRRQAWKLALDSWTEWDAFPTCLNHHFVQEEERNLGSAKCLEEMGRLREAAARYWDAIRVPQSDDPEVSRKLIELHRTLGSEDALRAQVSKEIATRGSGIEKGMRRLADELGVPVK